MEDQNVPSEHAPFSFGTPTVFHPIRYWLAKHKNENRTLAEPVAHGKYQGCWVPRAMLVLFLCEA